jgi:hypothetical protein
MVDHISVYYQMLASKSTDKLVATKARIRIWATGSYPALQSLYRVSEPNLCPFEVEGCCFQNSKHLGAI